MTIENDIDVLVCDVTTRKSAVVKAKGDLDAIVGDSASVARQTENAVLAALSARDEASAMATASTALATASVGATAYTDLAAVAACKVENAVDVLIYDTSLDSDGGAWRYRTQGTSWYQEALNSATRGSRREFPAVAVIVVETRTITIYDADSPDLPMWMVLTGEYFGIPQFQGGYTYTAAAMKNGVLAYTGSSQGVLTLNFISEVSVSNHSSAARCGEYHTPIARRGVASNFPPPGLPVATLSNNWGYSLAVTVLPDAAIDPATGFQKPTFAAATGNGIAVFNNDLIVAESSYTDGGGSQMTFVAFDEDGTLFYSDESFNKQLSMNTPAEYAVDQFAANQVVRNNSGWPRYQCSENIAVLSRSDIGVGEVADAGEGTIVGLQRLSVDRSDFTKSLSNLVTTSYTTGWMLGAIKGAWLADTDEGDLAEAIILDEDFSGYSSQSEAQATGWEFGQGWTFDTTSDSCNFDAAIAGAGAVVAINRDLEVVPGKTYVATAVLSGVTNVSGNELFIKADGVELANADGATVTSAGDGTYKASFVASSATINVQVRSGGVSDGDETASLESFSVRLADPDRSVNVNGLIIHGRVRRAPVADGAELVAYSGFSAENYLEQPYNADLDFGTGDFAVMGWVRTNLSSGWIFDTVDTGNAEGFAFFVSAGVGYFRTREVNNAQVIGSRRLDDGNWHFLVGVRSESGVNHSLYVDGVLDRSDTGVPRSIWATQSPLVVGNRQIDFAAPFAGDLALLRITGTAPSADQIARIYNYERSLFEPGAACTLYGDSDAVTALAHDKVTNLLHVGTSAGRSVFDGLRRVAHTTAPVGNAIAAHNGLIIED